MGKTVRGVIQAGLSIAAVIPGPQQPFVAAAAIAFNIANSTLFNSAQKSQLTTTSIRTERPPRQSGYGRVKMYGAQILYTAASDGAAVDVWAFHDGRIDAIEGYYLGDKPVTRLSSGFVQKGPAGEYGDNDTIQIGANLGLATETAHAAVVTKLPGIWTANHRGDGVVTGYAISKLVKAANYAKVYANGSPNDRPLGLVIRAQLLFDWRDPSQSVGDPRTWKWSENSWLSIVHYELVRQTIGPMRPPSHPEYWNDIAAIYTARWNKRIAPALEYWTAAADDADLAVPLKAGGTEPRYRACVTHPHAGAGSEYKSVLGALLATCDGWIASRSDGALVARAGQYYAPTVSIGPDEVTSYSDDDGIEDEGSVNEIGVTYISALHDFNQVDTDPWSDEDAIVERGAVRSDDVSNQVPSHAQARRLAKRKFAVSNAKSRGTFTTTRAGAKMLGERFIDLWLVEAVGTADEFEAFRGVAEITQLSRNPHTGAITAAWIAADENIDAWNPATEEGDPAPVGENIAREPLDTPTIISATATYSAVGSTPEGDEPIDPTPGQTATGARVLIAATGPDRADLTWYARWRVGVSGSWNEREYADADPGPAVSFTTEFVPLASNINVEVAYSVGDGRLSDWSDPTVVNTTTG